MFTSPKTYSQMLSWLNLATALSTFIYTAALTRFGFLPYVAIAKSLTPPIDIEGNKELVPWAAAAFGALPLLCTVVAFFFSRAFEIHNLASKALQIRFAWDKYHIVKPLRERAHSDITLDRETIREVMNEFYYDAVKKLDSHYPEMFWRYVLYFWVIFEHAIVVLVSVIVLALLKVPYVWKLALYLLAVLVIGALHFQFVVTKKTRDQVRQIPTADIQSYFKRLRLVAKL